MRGGGTEGVDFQLGHAGWGELGEEAVEHEGKDDATSGARPMSAGLPKGMIEV